MKGLQMSLLPPERVNLDKFLPHVMVAVSAAEDQPQMGVQAALSFIRNAAITFAERSRIIQRQINIDAQADLEQYPLLLDDCEDIIQVDELCMGKYCVQGVKGSCGYFEGAELFWFEDGCINLNCPPCEDMECYITGRFTVAPKRDACEVDAILYDRYHDYIVSGALAEIHTMPNRPWSSGVAADDRRRMFQDGIGLAKIRHFQGHTGDGGYAYTKKPFVGFSGRRSGSRSATNRGFFGR